MSSEHEKTKPEIPSADQVRLPKFLTIAAFLRRIPHDQPWQFTNVIRYGNAVTQFAKAIGVMYQTEADPVLGQVQVFPEPLLVRMYDHMAASLGWPDLPRAVKIRVLVCAGRTERRTRASGRSPRREGPQPD